MKKRLMNLKTDNITATIHKEAQRTKKLKEHSGLWSNFKKPSTKKQKKEMDRKFFEKDFS